MILEETLTTMATDLRIETFRAACSLAIEINACHIVETGCMRTDRMPNPDGSSTCVLGTLARDLDTVLSSIDNNAEHIASAKAYCSGLPVRFLCSDSVAALSVRAEPADFLYLDSYDFEAQNHMPSQLHQLAELGAVFGKLARKAIILIDDCSLPHGGKSGLSRQFLALRGWNLRLSKYQQLWTNF